MGKFFKLFSNQYYLPIAFLVLIVVSIGLISSNVANIRDPRPKASSSFVILPANGPGYFDGISTQFPNSGSHWDKVGEDVSDEDSTYLRSSVSNQKAVFTHKPLSIPSGSIINSVSFSARNKVENETSVWTQLLFYRSATDFKYANLHSPTNYASSATTLNKNPFTGGNWTVADVNNYQIGISLPNGGRVTQVFLRVVYTPPQPPATVSFSPDSSSIAYNTSTTIRWSSTDATSCSASGVWSGSKATSGSQSTGNLTSSKTYSISCTGAGGTSSTKSVSVTVGSKPPTPDPDPPPDRGGLPSIPSSPIGNEIDPNIVNFLKINLSVPFLLGNIKSPLIVGGFVQDLELKPGVDNYEVDVRGAKFPLGKDLKIQIGGNKALIKKLKINTKATKQVVKFGNLYLGDVYRDNKIDHIDIESYIVDIVNQGESSDVNADGVVNSLDWAILIVNFGKNGSR